MKRLGRNVARARAAHIREGAILPWLMGGVVLLAALVVLMAPAHARSGPEGFGDLADRLLPSVVNISTTQKIKGHQGMPIPQLPPGSPFEDFFKDFFGENGPGGRSHPDLPRRATSLGSGFIIDASGYVVTNNHVIQGAESVRVILQDDTVLDAEILGRDPKTDIALLKVDSDTPLPALTLGNSDKVKVGDWVLAIGNPFGLGGTVTAGIVSARARNINAGPYDDFIQTDASINRGNSGGPMFNMDGEVIGINTAILSPSGGSIGIGFAVPSNLAKPVLDDLREYGRARRGWLGVRIQTVTPEIAESLGLKDAQGALVANADEEGPAAEGGVKVGDVILSFNGEPVPEMRALPRMVAETAIGKMVPLKVWRNGKEVKLSITLGEMPEDLETAQAPGTPEPEGTEESLSSLGLTLATVNDLMRQRFDLPADARGVLVVSVDRESEAARKGMRPGDLIVEVNQTEVGSAEDVATAVAEARDKGRKSVLLLVANDQGLRFVALSFEED